MANHKSAEKRARQSEVRKVENKYFARTTRNAIKALRSSHESEAAKEELPKLAAMIDKLAKKNVIHKNKAANLKSKLTRHVNKMS